MNGPAVEVTQGIAARERSIASPSAAPDGHPRLTQMNVAEVPAWRDAVRKRRRNGKPEFILHAEKWR
jgi:hypothetical protein